MLPKCPRCGNEVQEVTNEWDYRQFHVKNYHCEKCNKGFKAYYLQGKLSHVIVSANSMKTRILKYLKKHENPDIFQIASELNLSVTDALETLLQLEKNGIVTSFIDKQSN